MAELEKSMGYLLANEGDNFVIDSGGPTKYGVTFRDLALFRGIPDDIVTNEMMEELTIMEATEIYRKFYWDKLRLNEVTNQNLATCIFDTSVNRGPEVAVKYTQKVLNTLGAALVVDGEMGLRTIAALNTVSVARFINGFEALEVAGYLAVIAAHPAYKIYENGWMNRAKKLFSLIS